MIEQPEFGVAQLPSADAVIKEDVEDEERTVPKVEIAAGGDIAG